MRSPTVTPTLQRLAAQAARDPARVFTPLAHLIDEDVLREAYRHTRKSSAPGMDGGTAEAYAEHLDENRRDRHERRRSGRYQAAPVERVWSETEDGSQRPIGTPAFAEKMVQRAVAMRLEAIDAQDFLDGSYGFRPGRHPHEALHALRERCMKEGIGWIVDADGSGDFDSMDRTRRREVLHQRVNDGSLWRLMGVLPKRCARFGLRIHPTKTTWGGFRKPKASQASAHGNGTFEFLGFTHDWARTRRGFGVIKRRTARKRLRRTQKALWQWCRHNRQAPLQYQYRLLCVQLRGHFRYYGIRDHCPLLENVRRYAEKAWRYWLSRRSRKSAIDWEKFQQLLAIYVLPTPKIVPNS